MSEKWDHQMLNFLKKTGEQIRGETEKILSEIRDPQNQQRVKDSLNEFGAWAKQTAEEATSLVETALKKAETTINKAAEKVKETSSAAMSSSSGALRRTRSHKRSPKRSAGAARSKSKRSRRT